MSFTSIPIRFNGQRVFNSWWNLLRDAGVILENVIGLGAIQETSFALANNQTGAASITGLLFSSASYRSAIIMATIRRTTLSEDRISTGLVKAYYKTSTSTWHLVDELSGTDEDDGTELTITAGGQVQYTTDNQAGTGYAGTIRFKAISFGV